MAPPQTARTPLKNKNLVESVYDELHRRISDGEMEAGEKVVIDQLARSFGISLASIREALARLSAERLVTYEQNKGYRVARAPSAPEIVELFEARLMLEVGALEVAASKVTPEILDDLSELNQKMAKGGYGRTFSTYRRFISLNAQFHQTLVALAGSPLINDAYKRLGYHQRIAISLRGRGLPDLDRLVSEHAALLEALRRGRLVEAQQVLRNHITEARQRLLAAKDGTVSAFIDG